MVGALDEFELTAEIRKEAVYYPDVCTFLFDQ